MAYNYGPPPGAYGSRQPSYPNQPPMGAPPDFGAPPGMDAPPGMAAQPPGGMPGQFQPPANLNFNAPVIRLGVGDAPRGPGVDRMGGDRGGREGRGSNAEPLGGRNRVGVGADPGNREIARQREQIRESMVALQPPTREEVARTIFVGGLKEGVPDDDTLAQILGCAGKLRRWTRARDADDNICKFGFAEYEDVESLEAAANIFIDLEVPLFNKDRTLQKEEGENGRAKEIQLLVVVDEQSKQYIDEWKGRKKESETDREFRIDTCKQEFLQLKTSIINSASHETNGHNGEQNRDVEGDLVLSDANGETKDDEAAIVNIPVALEDELADIPAEMRDTVAQEIKAFRDRSNRRDIDRLRREEESEALERRRTGAAARPDRLASPPPSGPASTSNGIPVGPRGQQGVQGAPSGPKGFRGAQLPSDYVNGVAFVGASTQEDEDAEESDDELERRRQEKKDEEKEKVYQEQLRRWQARERTTRAARERERIREEGEKQQEEKSREDLLARMASWDDKEEAANGQDLYYRDRVAWSRRRAIDREREEAADDADRREEEAELADEQRQANEARGMADDFLGSMKMDVEDEKHDLSGARGFKISLGGAAKTKQTQPTASAKRGAMADLEGLLEDEEDAAATGAKRPELKPLQDTSTLPEHGHDLSEDEKQVARQQLATEIPTETEALFTYPVKWDHISSSILESQIRPFVERKVVDYLGVQEDFIVDAILDAVKAKQDAKTIVVDLREAMEDEAEALVKKVWRLLVFWGESESRGLTT